MKRRGKCISKRTFAYRDDALKFAKRQYKLYGRVMAVYECPTCLDFHLTSKYCAKKLKKKWDKEIVGEQYSEFCLLFRKAEGKPRRNKVQKDKEPKKKPTLKGILPLSEQKKIYATLNKTVQKKWYKRLLDKLTSVLQ